MFDDDSVIYKALEDLVVHHDRGPYVMAIYKNNVSILGLSKDEDELRCQVDTLDALSPAAWDRLIRAIEMSGRTELANWIREIAPVAQAITDRHLSRG